MGLEQGLPHASSMSYSLGIVDFLGPDCNFLKKLENVKFKQSEGFRNRQWGTPGVI